MRFDGAKWAADALPGTDDVGRFGVERLSASPEGTLYALANGQVWSRPGSLRVEGLTLEQTANEHFPAVLSARR